MNSGCYNKPQTLYTYICSIVIQEQFYSLNHKIYLTSFLHIQSLSMFTSPPEDSENKPAPAKENIL